MALYSRDLILVLGFKVKPWTWSAGVGTRQEEVLR